MKWLFKTPQTFTALKMTFGLRIVTVRKGVADSIQKGRIYGFCK